MRTWGLRGTLHLLTAEDLSWLLPLCGPVFIPAGQTRRAELGLDEETCVRGMRSHISSAAPRWRASSAWGPTCETSRPASSWPIGSTWVRLYPAQQPYPYWPGATTEPTARPTQGIWPVGRGCPKAMSAPPGRRLPPSELKSILMTVRYGC